MFSVLIFVNSSFLFFSFPISLPSVALLFLFLFLKFLSYFILYTFSSFIRFSLSSCLLLCFTLASYVESITSNSNFGCNIDYCQEFHNFPLFLQANYGTHMLYVLPHY
jgi:hypothetical protein